MGIFRQFPYSNFHEMNMDWIITQVKQLIEEWATYHAQWDEWQGNITEIVNDLLNWFNTLDVQEEINNKIDEMAESGELISLIAPFLPFITPEMFGAVGDGITDDTQAIQSAIDTKLPIVLTGKYLVKSAIRPKNDLIGISDNAELYLDQTPPDETGVFILITAVSDITIKNIKIDYLNDDAYQTGLSMYSVIGITDNSKNIELSQIETNAFYFSQCEGTDISNVAIKNCVGLNAMVSNLDCPTLVVENCTFNYYRCLAKTIIRNCIGEYLNLSTGNKSFVSVYTREITSSVRDVDDLAEFFVNGPSLLIDCNLHNITSDGATLINCNIEGTVNKFDNGVAENCIFNNYSSPASSSCYLNCTGITTGTNTVYKSNPATPRRFNYNLLEGSLTGTPLFFNYDKISVVIVPFSHTASESGSFDLLKLQYNDNLHPTHNFNVGSCLMKTDGTLQVIHQEAGTIAETFVGIFPIAIM